MPERVTNVLDVFFDQRHHVDLLAHEEERTRLIRQSAVVIGVSFSDRGRATGVRFEFRLRIPAEQLVDGIATGVRAGCDQRLVGKGGEVADRCPGHRLRRVPREAAAEHGQCSEHVALVLPEQSPGVFENGAHTPMTVGDVSHLGLEEIQRLRHLIGDLGHREHVHPGGRQQNSQRRAARRPQDDR